MRTKKKAVRRGRREVKFNPISAKQFLCKHPDVWFDRSVEVCGPQCSEDGEMHDRCTECGITWCQRSPA